MIQDAIQDAIVGLRAMAPIVSLRYLPTQRLSVLKQLHAAVRGLQTSDNFGQDAHLLYWSHARGFEYIKATKSSIRLSPIPTEDEDAHGNPVPHILFQHGFRAKNGAGIKSPSDALNVIATANVTAVVVMDGLAEFIDDKFGASALQVSAILDRSWHALMSREAVAPVLNDDDKPVQVEGRSQMTLQPNQACRWVIVGGMNPALPPQFQDRVRMFNFKLPELHEIETIIDKTCQGLELQNGFPYSLKPEEKRKLAIKMQLLPEEEIATVTRIGAIKYGASDRCLVDVAEQERRRLLEYTNLSILNPPPNDLGGMDNLKAWVGRVLEPSIKLGMEHPEVPKAKGLLLVGPPGTGKTAMAAKIAADLGVLGIKLNIADMLNSHLGASEANINRTLEMAEALAPCILFIDEVDKEGIDKNNDGHSDGGVTKRLFGSLLRFMTEDRDRQVMVIMTANRIGGIPSEFFRAGRIDETFWVDLPSKSEREKILKIFLAQKRHKLNHSEIKQLAQSSDAFSGAELKAVVDNAWRFAYSRVQEVEATIIGIEDCNAAITSTIPLAKRDPDDIKAMREQCRHAASASAVKKRNSRPNRVAMNSDDDPVNLVV